MDRRERQQRDSMTIIVWTALLCGAIIMVWLFFTLVMNIFDHFKL